MKALKMSAYLLSLFFPCMGLSQTESPLGHTSAGKPYLYYTINTSVFKDFEINKHLKDADLLGFRQVGLGASIGGNIYIGSTFFNIEGGAQTGFPKKESGKKTNLRYLLASFNYFIRVFKLTPEAEIFFGGGYHFTTFKGDVVSKNSNVNLNSISQADLRGTLNLNATSHGLEFSFYLLNSRFGKNWLQDSSVKASYILDLSKPEWESESANLTESFSENFSRFNIELILPIKWAGKYTQRQ